MATGPSDHNSAYLDWVELDSGMRPRNEYFQLSMTSKGFEQVKLFEIPKPFSDVTVFLVRKAPILKSVAGFSTKL